MTKIVLNVASRKNRNAEYEITKATSRIGSGDACDIHIFDKTVPEFALLLENRKGKFFVHNQTDDPIKVGTKLFKEKSLQWNTNETLHLGRVLKLQLQFKEETEDSISANVADLKELNESGNSKIVSAADQKAELAQAKAKKNQTMMLIFIIVAVLGYLVFNEITAKPPADAAHVATFDEAIEECAGDELADLRKRIQFVESRYSAGDYGDANRLFTELRNELDNSEGFEITKEYLARRIADSSE